MRQGVRRDTRIPVLAGIKKQQDGLSFKPRSSVPSPERMDGAATTPDALEEFFSDSAGKKTLF